MKMAPPPADLQRQHEHNFHSAYRPDIDGLRALAILPVVAFHAFPKWISGGFAGVDIFFVISGFLISSIIFRSLANGDFRFTEFYAHRIKRIFPALILVLTACYVLGWFTLLPDEFKQLGKHMAAGAGFVQNFVLWNEAGYFDVASELKPLMHLWSLAIEEQFYLFYPILVWAAWRGGVNVLTGVVLLGLVSLALNAKGIHHDAIKTFFAPQTRVWELMTGALLAYVHGFKCWPPVLTRWLHYAFFNRVVFKHLPAEKDRSAVLASLLSFIGLLLLVASVFGLDRSMPYPGLRAVFPVMGACLLILTGPAAWVNRKLLAHRLMVWIGLISYPLYLWHWPLLSFARIVESETPSRDIRLTAVGISFVLAWLTYMLIEKPIRFGRISWRKTAVLCVLAVLVGYAGYNTYVRDGLAFRMKETVRRNTMLDPKTVPWKADDLCKQRFPGYPYDYCRLGKDAAPTVLLLGDSHAAALFAGMSSVLETTQDNLLHLGMGGCVAFFDMVSQDQKANEQERRKCSDTTTKALNLAESDTTIHTVILASRGPLYLSGKGFFHDNSFEETNHDRILQLTTRHDLTDHAKIWEIAMRNTLQRLLAKNKRIIFVLDNAELGFDPRSCVNTRPLRITANKVRQPCAVPRKDFDERNRAYRELVQSVLKDYPAVKAFDAAAPLCDKEWCWAMKDGQMLYYDDDHLSLDGSRLIATEMVRLLPK